MLFRDLRVGVGVGRDKIEIVEHGRPRLDLDATRPDLAGLDLEAGIGEVRCLHIGLRQLVDSRLQEGVVTWRLILEAGLILLALGPA